ncbi:hypothetical protein ACVBGD_28830 [Klebsiella pneumoniae]
MTKKDDQKNCPECDEEGRNMMLSLEDIFGDSIREMRERDKEFLPKTEWFSRIETDLDTFMQTYMTKYPFRGPPGKRNLWSLPFLQHRF